MLKHFSVHAWGILQIQLKVNRFSLNCSFKIKKIKSVLILILFANYLVWPVLFLSPWWRGGHVSRNTKLQLCHCCLNTLRFSFFCSIHTSLSVWERDPSSVALTKVSHLLFNSLVTMFFLYYYGNFSFFLNWGLRTEDVVHWTDCPLRQCDLWSSSGKMHWHVINERRKHKDQ